MNRTHNQSLNEAQALLPGNTELEEERAMAIRVLYVDDDPDLREIAEIALSRNRNLVVRFAESGDAALRIIDAGAWVPDIVILDVRMPGLDGPATHGEMKKRGVLAQTRYAFVSAISDAGERDRLFETGVDRIVKKPFDMATFADEVEGIAK